MKDERAKSKEQRAKSKEQRAKMREVKECREFREIRDNP